MHYSRRSFIKASAFASTAFLIPEFLKASSFFSDKAYKGKRLVVVQLSGGNDGLNSIVPWRNDLYYQNRPSLGLSGNDLIRMNDDAAFNSHLEGLSNLYDDGHVAIINSVGYPNPNRSHFRSMDIWQSASDEEKYIQSGWIGRVLDSTCNDCAMPYTALEIDDSLSLAMKGERMKGLALRDVKKLKDSVDNNLIKSIADNNQHSAEENQTIAFLRKTFADTVHSADYLAQHQRMFSSRSVYPDHDFGRQMKLIAELIISGTETMIYYVSLPGFDTHALQLGIQNRQLKVYADTLKTFCHDLKSNDCFNDTIVLTFSEFGRRVAQNGSKGTDHGTANNVYIIGGQLKNKGLINPLADLQNLSEGDLIHKVDFRSVYATVIDNWLKMDSKAVLGGRQFDLLNFV